jgi:hypothetical protein
VNHLKRQTLLTINRKHFFMNILSVESFCLQKRIIECCFLVVHPQAQSHFTYCNQLLNMCMHVCYIDCHGVGLCCYLVIHIENLLRPLQLFYFHLWSIYRLSLIVKEPGIFSFSYPEWPWGPPSLLSNGYWWLFPQGVKLTAHLQLLSRSRKYESIHPLPHTPSWHSA